MSIDDQELALRQRDVNDEEYDPHWCDRLLPGNQEIYNRANEQQRRLHEEYVENTARSIARRHATKGAPGPRFQRPPGRVTGPSPWVRDTAPPGTPHPVEARRLSVTGFNLLVERARVLRLTQGPSLSPPACRSPTGDSTPTSPTRPTIQGRRRLQTECGPTREDNSQNTSSTSTPCEAACLLEPCLERMTRVLERHELLVQRPAPAATPRARPRGLTPTKPKQKIRYIVKRGDGHAHREAAPTCPGSDVSDTALSGGGTPRGLSPAREDQADAARSGPADEGSTDEAEAWHAPPMPFYQGAASFVSTINIYRNVRLADIMRADPIEMTPLGGGGYQVATSPTWPMESTIHMDTDEEPSVVPPRVDTAGYHLRSDTSRDDTLVQPPGPDSDKQVTTAGKLQPVRTLTNWIDDIHGRGGEAVRRRRLADSPISHHNSWERVPTHPTGDTLSGVYDGGGT